MRLSIIIVNYNVRAFLEKCLISVYQASQDLECEIFVVDNHSLDDSVAMVRSRFPDVHLIENNENLGFAAANNQALRQARGKYVLLLNPDTVVSEDTFKHCYRFMEEHPDAGAVGVSMLDGTGTWLPESKRGLPSPLSSFFKLTGINNLFPKSNFFNGYYLGGLDPAQTAQVEILTGAFMFIRKEALDLTGLLDEDYFMYGEDIDLSYRILKAGYHNYYLPTTSIIHYKGESTRRSSLEYVKTFYRAMLTFVRKNYSGPRGAILTQFLRVGIFLRAALSGLSRLFSALIVPAIDLAIMIGIILAVKAGWAVWYFEDMSHFDDGFVKVNLPLYTGIWFANLALFGTYAGRRNPGRAVRALVVGTIVVLVAYALLPLQFRSSRAVILLSASLVIMAIAGWSTLLQKIQSKRTSKRIAVVGSQAETERIMELLNRIEPHVRIVGGVSVADRPRATDHLGYLEKLDEIARTHRIDEVIFSSEDLPFSRISLWMARLSPRVRFKIASAQSDAMVGSDSKKLAGDLYASDIQFSVATELQRRNKRIFDILLSLSILAVSPFGIFSRKYRNLAAAASEVLKGSRTWVGYDPSDTRLSELPPLKEGVYTPGGLGEGVALREDELHMINYLYAREYRLWRDIEVLLHKGRKRT